MDIKKERNDLDIIKKVKLEYWESKKKEREMKSIEEKDKTRTRTILEEEKESLCIKIGLLSNRMKNSTKGDDIELLRDEWIRLCKQRSKVRLALRRIENGK